jgi:hypothetical protein
MKKNIFLIPDEEIEIIGEENQIYGFPLISGLKMLSNEIINVSKYQKINFINGIDLGCGDGQVINYFNQNIPNSNWTGIELSNYRISLSNNPDDIIEGDLLEISYSDFNFLYINNLAFDNILCSKIEIKIFNEFYGIILVSKPFCYKNLNKKTKIIKTIKVDTNWQKNHIFYFYLLK